jgi:ATP-binding protein involved in chromosome partitioning
MKSIFMVSFRQVSPFDFEIKWSDQTSSHLNLAKLQQSCPCASCNQMRLEKSDTSQAPLALVKAYRVVSVGRYAIRIQFTAGCSQGIYTYDHMRNLELTYL